MKKIKVTIKGISPLLMNRFPESEGKLEEKSKRRMGNPDYDKEAEQKLYKYNHQRKPTNLLVGMNLAFVDEIYHINIYKPICRYNDYGIQSFEKFGISDKLSYNMVSEKKKGCANRKNKRKT